MPGGVDPSGKTSCPKATCRANLLNGETPRRGKVVSDKITLGTVKGVAKGRIGWEATDSGATLVSSINSKKIIGEAEQASNVKVSCSCNAENKCRASYIIGGYGLGKLEVGDAPKGKPAELPHGDVGKQDLFVANSGLVGFASGRYVTVWGYVGWQHQNRRWHNSPGNGLSAYDTTTTDVKLVKFTWKCVGNCYD